MVGPDRQRSLDSGCFELVGSHHIYMDSGSIATLTIMVLLVTVSLSLPLPPQVLLHCQCVLGEMPDHLLSHSHPSTQAALHHMIATSAFHLNKVNNNNNNNKHNDNKKQKQT